MRLRVVSYKEDHEYDFFVGDEICMHNSSEGGLGGPPRMRIAWTGPELITVTINPFKLDAIARQVVEPAKEKGLFARLWAAIKLWGII